MSAVMIVLLAVLGYLVIAVGVLRYAMPRQYESLRTPRNGRQMPEADARRESIRAAAQWAFLWPVWMCAFGLLVPMVVVFDGIPAAGRAAGRGAVAAGRAAAPALAPVTTWATKPLDAAVTRDRQLALAARADEPVADTPLIPDEIATWTPPVTRMSAPSGRVYDVEPHAVGGLKRNGWDPFDDPAMVEYIDPVIEHMRARRTRREEA